LHPIFFNYIELLEEAQRDPSTIVNNRQAFAKFTKWANSAGIDPAEVTPVEMRRFVQAMLKAHAVSTAERHFIHVRAAYSYAHECGLVPLNPTAGIAKLLPNLPDAAPRILTGEELRRLLAATTSEIERLALYIFALTGLRKFELAGLSWREGASSYVDFTNEQFVIVGKGGKHRLIPMHPILTKRLAEAAALSASEWVFPSNYTGSHISERQMGDRFRKLFDRAGLSDCEKPTHVFRATLNTNLGRLDVRDSVLDAIFGWSATTVRSRHYTGVVTQDAVDAILLAFTDDPVFPEQAVMPSPVAAAPAPVDDMALRIRLLELENENLRLKAQLAEAPALAVVA
jgi:integrase